ncbi:MAG TPA: M23 family metallopeptidase [Gaiellaceae bacterium]|nr:M23 family metallopeptidase [Gaiellaceae bacterium]
MRRGVSLLILALTGAALAAAGARAAAGTTTTTGTTTTSAPAYAPLAASSLPRSCVGAGIAAIREPQHTTRAVGTPASSLGPSAYPTRTPVLAFDSASATGSTCRDDGVTLDGVAFFGGAVTATTVEATHGAGTVTGLVVDGTAVTPTAGESVAVGNWGVVTIGAAGGRVSAPLSLQLLRARDSLPKGTTIFLAFAAVAQPRPVAKPKPQTTPTTTVQTTASAAPRHHARRRRKKKHHVPQPLKQTPLLGLKASRYVFPVDSGASYVDTYGANRSDVYDGWHHGDDLFAPLGTPVVAVAKGKLSLVGWNELGGWRLWLTDAKGNSFYYAHLSGYSRWILHHRNVRAGEVVGFLGRTGDAFTTTPHLHFEVHPHQLLKLGYDGAVDPTSYLHAWRVETLPASEIPRPARLRAPRGTPAQEASVVWKQLIAARHLLPDGDPVVAFAAATRRAFPPAQEIGIYASARRIAAVRTASHVAAPSTNDGPWPLAVLVLTLAISACGAFAGVRRRRRTTAG